MRRRKLAPGGGEHDRSVAHARGGVGVRQHAAVGGEARSGRREAGGGRGEGLETYAYPFIHADDIKAWIAKLFGGNMQFDVIIGNPPY